MQQHERTVGLWTAVCAGLFFVGLALLLAEQTALGGWLLGAWLLSLMGLAWTDHRFTQRRRAARQGRRD